MTQETLRLRLKEHCSKVKVSIETTLELDEWLPSPEFDSIRMRLFDAILARQHDIAADILREDTELQDWIIKGTKWNITAIVSEADDGG